MKTEIVNGELPYRVEIDGLRGAATSPSQAVLAALRVGKKIPPGCRSPKDAAAFLFWSYEPNTDWVRLIHILEHNTFEEQDAAEAQSQGEPNTGAPRAL